MNAKETLKIISKQWCTIDDLKKLSHLGNNKAYKLRNEIKRELEDQGYLLPKGLIPMYEVVKKLNIDIDYLKKLKRI